LFLKLKKKHKLVLNINKKFEKNEKYKVLVYLDIKKYIDMNLNELCLYIIIDYIEIIIS
jgi:hypothetical protein